jgi:hypothetical protein
MQRQLKRGLSIRVLEANFFMGTGKVNEMSAQIGQKAPDFKMHIRKRSVPRL